jgi:hypothetical protein
MVQADVCCSPIRREVPLLCQGFFVMTGPVIRRSLSPPKPANDNKPQLADLCSEVLIPADLPITQVEIEVFAALLDDWSGIAANDNEEPAP